MYDEIINFYFSLYNTFVDGKQPFRPQSFFVLSDEMSEGAAVFLKDRNK
jgi:hypothetical protein